MPFANLFLALQLPELSATTVAIGIDDAEQPEG